jgi:sugar lactone lactonase YvrE
MPAPQALITGLEIGESPRWHHGRLWLSNWGAQEVIAADLEGNREVVVRVPTTIPFCIDWLPDGRLLIVSGPERLLLRQEPDGSLVTHADLAGLSEKGFNEIVVDGRGNTYVNGGGFDLRSGEPTPGIVYSYGKELTAFDIADDGGLSNRRAWADLGDGVPDGICIDAEGAVWYADVPNKRCVRVGEGGEVQQSIEVDRGCFACMLGGPNGTTLFIVAAEWQGFANMFDKPGTGQVLSVEAPAAGAGWP